MMKIMDVVCVKVAPSGLPEGRVYVLSDTLEGAEDLVFDLAVYLFGKQPERISAEVAKPSVAFVSDDLLYDMGHSGGLHHGAAFDVACMSRFDILVSKEGGSCKRNPILIVHKHWEDAASVVLPVAKRLWEVDADQNISLEDGDRAIPCIVPMGQD